MLRFARNHPGKSAAKIFASFAALAATVAFSALSAPAISVAGVVTYDFNSGFGPDFTSFNYGGLWTIDDDGPTVRLPKPADDGSFSGDGFILAGILSSFTLDGDFSITVDFTLDDFPFPPGSQQLNESLLAVVSDSGGLFEVLRFNQNRGRSRIEAFSVPETPGLPAPTTSLYEGVYRIDRMGSTISGSFGEPGASLPADFTDLGSATGPEFALPMRIQLYAAQGANSGGRSTTSLDVSFDNLRIETSAVPEPASLVMWLVGLPVAASVWMGRRWKSARNGRRQLV